MRMVHEWRHLRRRQLKRAGRGHDEGGPAGTQQGACAVKCPACPWPGINLLKKERHLGDLYVTSTICVIPAEDLLRWLDALFLAIDANFRLRRNDISSILASPGFNQGIAYIVNDASFRIFLVTWEKNIHEDKSTCNNYDAIKSAASRRGKGLAVTGMGMVQCNRHDMKRPNCCGDLHFGER